MQLGKLKQCDYGETAFVFDPISYHSAPRRIRNIALMVHFTPRDAVNTDVTIAVGWYTGTPMKTWITTPTTWPGCGM